MNEHELKKNGKKYKLIKKKPSAFDGMIQPHSEVRIGDIYSECNDGWYSSSRTEERVNIDAIAGKEEYYQEIKILEVEFYVSIGYVGCNKQDTVKLQIPEEASEDEINDIIREEYNYWLLESIETSWAIKQ